MSLVLSLLTTAIGLLFTGVVYRQYIDRWRPYQLVWSIALAIFTVGTFCQFVAERNGWTPVIYRVWYYAGAMLAAAYLGQGTIYLMAPRRVAHVTMALLGSLTSAGLVLAALLPVNLDQAITPAGVTGNGFPPLLLVLLIPLNTYGTVALVGGALLSLYRFWRSGTMGQRAVGTLLIAIGGLTVALGGTANRFGIPGLLYVTEMVGLALIFAGYLQTMAQRTVAAPERPVLTTRAEPPRRSSAQT